MRDRRTVAGRNGGGEAAEEGGGTTTTTGTAKDDDDDDDDDGDDDRTYVWARLRRDGSLLVPPGSGDGASASASPADGGKRKERRDAKAGAASSDDFWGWTPGYYVRSFARGGAEASARYHLTLLLGDADGDDDRQRRRRRRRCVLSESVATRLMESGNIVLANAWEIRDFRGEDDGGEEDDEHGSPSRPWGRGGGDRPTTSSG